jgi:glutamine phosphoribosylpyrophosphate amidotransferase
VNTEDDKPKEECGVFATYTPGLQAAKTAYFALFALQHRGQEGAGLVTSDGWNFHVHRGTGLVSQIFDEEKINQLPGSWAIGHTRYSTTGKSMGTNTQPFIVETIHGPMAMAHNGQLTQGRQMRQKLMERGVGMFTTSDSECIIQSIASRPDIIVKEEPGKANWEARIASFMVSAEGAYSCVMMTRQALFAFRDPHGLRPLCLGTVTYNTQRIGATASLSSSLNKWGSRGERASSLSSSSSSISADASQSSHDSSPPHRHPNSSPAGNLLVNPASTSVHVPTIGYVVASESCALSTIGAELLRDIRPGEVVRIDENGISTVSIFSSPSSPLTDMSLKPVIIPGLQKKFTGKKVTSAPGTSISEFSPSSSPRSTPLSPSTSESSPSASGPDSTTPEDASESALLDGRSSPFPRPNQLPLKSAFCVFEYVYFARPDSVIEGRLVHAVRQNLGRTLAKEAPVPHADVVVGVPDSSTPIAIGYAQECGKPFTEGLTKNRYIARTFIQPDQSLRIASVELKYNTLGVNLKDKVVVLVDDSIVRGTTSAQLVDLLKRGGAKEVHLRIGSPPVKHPCFMGIDMRTGNELIAATSPSLEQIAALLGADSLAYISQEGMIQSVLEANSAHPQDAQAVSSFCSACFTGEYPLPVDSW